MFTPDPNQLPQTGATLRAMREGAGLSLAEVAERARTPERTVSKGTLSRFERGQRNISAELLERIVRVIADELKTKRDAA